MTSTTLPTRSAPDFLVIGAQRAGTTWLYECIKKHPELWLPPAKELHYFDRSPRYPSPSYLYPDQPLLRLIGHDSWNKVYRNLLVDCFRHNFSNREVFNWYLKYYMLPVNDRWYTSLFQGANGKVTGEITPAYAILDRVDVEHIARLLPNLKVVFILRHPVERVWSQFRFCVRLGEVNPELSIDEFKEWVDTPLVSQRSDYQRTLSIWSSVFPENQIFVGFYDQISAEPTRLLSSVLEFIGVSSDPETVKGIVETERINESPEREIPHVFKEFLQSHYKNDVEALVERFGNSISHWLPPKASAAQLD